MLNLINFSCSDLLNQNKTVDLGFFITFPQSNLIFQNTEIINGDDFYIWLQKDDEKEIDIMTEASRYKFELGKTIECCFEHILIGEYVRVVACFGRTGKIFERDLSYSDWFYVKPSGNEVNLKINFSSSEDLEEGNNPENPDESEKEEYNFEEVQIPETLRVTYKTGGEDDNNNFQVKNNENKIEIKRITDEAVNNDIWNACVELKLEENLKNNLSTYNNKVRLSLSASEPTVIAVSVGRTDMFFYANDENEYTFNTGSGKITKISIGANYLNSENSVTINSIGLCSDDSNTYDLTTSDLSVPSLSFMISKEGINNYLENSNKNNNIIEVNYDNGYEITIDSTVDYKDVGINLRGFVNEQIEDSLKFKLLSFNYEAPENVESAINAYCVEFDDYGSENVISNFDEYPIETWANKNSSKGNIDICLPLLNTNDNVPYVIQGFISSETTEVNETGENYTLKISNPEIIDLDDLTGKNLTYAVKIEDYENSICNWLQLPVLTSNESFVIPAKGKRTIQLLVTNPFDENIDPFDANLNYYLKFKNYTCGDYNFISIDTLDGAVSLTNNGETDFKFILSISNEGSVIITQDTEQ